ncbi:hypothetical protein DB346_14920 [Verrucomicrobia bacterium LW23]|nr:hypothetical protein DB346_14920 [Verrucomicrobia bacterium LW23]
MAGGAAWIAPRLERKVLAFPGCERFAAAVQSAISEEALSRAQALEAAARLGDAGFCAGRDALAQRIAAPARRSLPERPRGAPADLRPLPPYEAATAEDRAGTTTLPCTQEQIVDYIQRRWRGDRCIVLPPGCEGAMMPDFSASGRRGRDSSTDGG